MKTLRMTAVAAAVASLVVLGAAPIAGAGEYDLGRPLEVSVLGGIHALNENDTALPDHFVNIPLTAAVTYHLTRIFAVEGEFTWMIPLEKSVDLGSGGSVDLKTPDVLAYQASVLAHVPAGGFVKPYVAAGLGAVTFLSNTDADRVPQLDEAETMFAINFGTGLAYRVTGHWGLRADLRAFVAFPSDDAAGLSNGGDADEIWMERGTLGVVYGF